MWEALKKTTQIIPLALLIIVMQLPGLTVANFTPVDPNLPAIPNKDPPQVILNSPQNYQNYSADTPIEYSITIKVPLSWFNLKTGESYCSIRGIGYYIAPNTTAVVIAGQPLEPNSPPTLESIAVPKYSMQNTTIKLNGTLPTLPIGHQALIVGVSWSSLYQTSNFWHVTAEYDSIAYSNMTNFSITDQQQEAADSALTQELTPTIILVLFVASPTVVAIVLLLVLRKRKLHKSLAE
jgi:hypothetical protein